MTTKKSTGALTRVNQILAGDGSSVSSVYTLHQWSASGRKASVGPLPDRTKCRAPDKDNIIKHTRTQRKRHQVLSNTRARQVLIKLQESALNFLIRWFLLEETSQGDDLTQAFRFEPRHRPRVFSHHQQRQQHNAPPRHQLRVDRFGILIDDLSRLPRDKRNVAHIARCLYWRWFTRANVVELVLIAFLVAFCVYQCYELLEEYYSYPTHIFITNVLNDNFRVDLPGLTICDNNRLSKETISKNFPRLNMTHLLAISQGTFVSVDNFSVSSQEASTLTSGPYWQLDEWRQSSDTPETLPLVDLAEMAAATAAAMVSQQNQSNQLANNNKTSGGIHIKVLPGFNEINWLRVLRFLSENKPARMYDLLPNNSLVDSLVCANINGDQIPCEDLARVQSIQEVSRCETLFHEPALWDTDDPRVQELERHIERHPTKIDLDSNKYDDQEYLEFDEETERREGLEEEMEEQQHEHRLRMDMNNMEVVRLRLRFNAEDYANPRQLVGSRLAIHSGSMIGQITHKMYKLEPGYWYTFYIYRSDYIRLPPPYSTNCYDYDLNRRQWRQRTRWLRNSRDKINELTRRQAKSSTPIKEYVEVLKMRSIGKVS